MQVSGPVLWSVFSVPAAFCAGLLAVEGRAIGEGDIDKAQRAVWTSFVLALVTGVVAGLICWFARGSIAAVMTSPNESAPALRALAETYMGIVLLSTPAAMLGAASTVALQAAGDTKTPMWIAGLCGIANLAISWVLIYGHYGLPELGIVGAAIGTVISFIALPVLSVGVLLFRKAGFRAGPIRGVDRASLRSILGVSRAAYGERVAFHTAFLIFAGYVGHLGAVEMAANQALIAIESLSFIVGDAFSIAGGALVAQKLGAKLPEEAAACGWIAAALATAVLSCCALFYVLLAEPLISLVDPSPEVVSLGVPCLLVAAVAQPFMAGACAIAGALRGAGDTRSPLLATLVGPCVIRLGLCWLFAFEFGWGLIGIWAGTTVDWAARAVFLVVVFKRDRWKTIDL
jgi:putative MATE family efflux protein